MAKNILVPIDGSDFMERNVNYACDMAKYMNAKVTLMHVVTVPIVPELAFQIDAAPLEKAGAQILKKAKEIARAKGVDAATKQATAYGNAAHEIIKTVKEGEFDLVIIGAKGHSILMALTVGSVADSVVHNASCSVLVVR